MVNTWILVADASRARIYQAVGTRPWSVVGEFSHPESRVASRKLVSDRAGRARKRAWPGSALMDGGDPKSTEVRRFAHLLAGELRQAAGRGAYEQLVLVASPHFLGLLRRELGAQLMKRVVLAMPKDLTTLEPREVRRVVGKKGGGERLRA